MRRRRLFVVMGVKAVTRRKSHLAVYGNVGIIRAECPGCGDVSLVVDGRSACCAGVVEDRPETWKRMVEPEFARKQPCASDKRVILSEQDNRCLYCEGRFGSHIWHKGKHVRLIVRWDHVIPFAFNGNNDGHNFAAACQICNAIKSDKIFTSLEEARAHIAAQRNLTETPVRLSSLSDPFQAKTD